VRKTRVALALLVTGMATGFLVGPWKTKPVIADDDGKKITIRDDCDPDDVAGWASTGGCALEEGDVNRAEFDAELSSPLSLSVIGHQAWRNDPSYLKIETEDAVKVRNRGGRTHTFTEVAAFGGGRVPNPALNKGLTMAPECPTSVDIAPGAGVKLSGLSPGNHKFQCCIHPWMRAIVKVKEDD
jgi:plastocyanin